MVNVFEISKTGIVEMSLAEFNEHKLKDSSLYIYKVQGQRDEAIADLKDWGVDAQILAYMQEPSEHIRFKIYDELTYGEISYFSRQAKPHLKYIGLISQKNILFLIHEDEDKLLFEFFEELKVSISRGKKNIDDEFITYILLHEILTLYGKRILSFREEIEAFALAFDQEVSEIEPEELLEAKSHLSDFSRVFEKLYFTLNFPPAVDVLHSDSAYMLYFKDLLKTMEVLKISITDTENRLNSLHDHFLLLLQEKSNKRINFLTIIQSIFVPLTLIAGVYGMNFVHMPELSTQYGYFIVLGVMGLTTLGFIVYFFKHKWFD